MTSRYLLLVLAVAGCGPTPSPENRAATAAARVIATLTPPVQLAGTPPVEYALAERMAHYHVPGVSIAVVDSGRLAWAKGYGLKAAGSADSVGPETLFQAASISKPVAATAMLRLVQDGRLNLDQDVNAYLTSWKVPENKFTKDHKVTLRRLASHSAGLTVHGFPGYKAGDSVPTLPEILDGKKPANTGPVRVDTIPGTRWKYSGGGTTIMQMVVMDVTKEPFAAVAKRLVLDPAGMTSSTYEQPLPAALHATAATAHKPDGTATPGKWHTYPEQGAAGLWTTPTDLLKWAMAIASSRDGSDGSVLSQDIAKQMLTVQKGDVGLGPFLGGKGRGFHFGHGGSNEGFRSELIYFPATGQGAAVMTNGDQGSDLINEILFAIAAEYHWPEYAPRTVTPLAVDSVAMDKVVGDYEVKGEAFTLTFAVRRDGERLRGEVVGMSAPSEVVFVEADKLLSVDSGNEVTVVRGADGIASALQIGGIRLVRKE